MGCSIDASHGQGQGFPSRMYLHLTLGVPSGLQIHCHPKPNKGVTEDE